MFKLIGELSKSVTTYTTYHLFVDKSSVSLLTSDPEISESACRRAIFIISAALFFADAIRRAASASAQSNRALTSFATSCSIDASDSFFSLILDSALLTISVARS